MYGDLVAKLQELGIETGGIRRQTRTFRVVGQRLGGELQQRDAMEQGRQFLKRRIEGKAAGIHGVGHVEHGLHVARQQTVENGEQIVVANRAQHVAHPGLLDSSGAMGDGLIEQD